MKIDRETGNIVRYSFDTGDTSLWIDNQSLYFNNLTLEEISARLERIYDVKIIIDSEKLKKSRFYASFLEAGSAEQVLDALCSANMMKVTKQGNNNTFIISESKL